MESPSKTALVILVPEAESIVKEWREIYDSSAADRMPAHITILYPFKPLGDIGSTVTADLKDLFLRQSRFDFSLNEIGRFQEVLYLAPSHSSRFKELIQTVTAEYPDTPLYGGVSFEVVPHVTVAMVKDNARLDEISREFHRASEGKFPINAHAGRVSLMVKRQQGWEIEISFDLSRGSHPPSDC